MISNPEDSETSSECGCSDSCGEEEDSEEWHRDVDDLLEDVAGDEALSEPSRHQSSVQSLTSFKVTMVLNGSCAFCSSFCTF